MSVIKKAYALKKGDKILSNTNWYLIEDVRPSALTGRTYPVIDIVDAFGNHKTIETGANEKFQDHLYEVEPAQ